MLRAVRWTARTLALDIVVLIAAFVIGEGIDVAALTARESLLMAAFALLCAGLLLGWRFETLGGGLALGAWAAFYIIQLSAAGRTPRGWVFPLLALPAILFLFCAAAERARGHGRRV